jgi:chemotaxis protein MotA
MGIVFFVFGFAAVVLAFILEGGEPAALLGLTPAIIVFGGVIGATGLTTPTDILKSAMSAIPVAFKSRKSDPVALINYFSEISMKARKNGLLVLESEIKDEKVDRFLCFGLTQVVDGVHNDEVRNSMESEVSSMSERHASRAKVFEAAGGYAPTMGIIGTVMGLVHVLGNLSDPESLGPLIAAAFLATLYGISSANLIFLPIGARLKALDEKEVREKEMIIEGISSIQKGDSPVVMRRMLETFLDAKQKAKLGTKE